MLKVSPWKGVVRFAKKGKLTPRYVGPFEIIERIGPVAYRLSLPNELSGVHDVFHVSNLKKCFADETLIIPIEEIQLDEHLRFVEEPLEIMDRKVKQLRRSRIPIVKVRWNSRHGPEFTWEREDHMRNKYPQLFAEEAEGPAAEWPKAEGGMAEGLPSPANQTFGQPNSTSSYSTTTVPIRTHLLRHIHSANQGPVAETPLSRHLHSPVLMQVHSAKSVGTMSVGVEPPCNHSAAIFAPLLQPHYAAKNPKP
ncbi:hypothetical protein E3N88_37427 [Mikania micrantha]|uniref:Tf2-1-like SH3-like domain-containing protein n=1 Tax=Mikania micrantha TaxID=192012 RepID=A0A5N6LR99_9ASTR|nr:hypothetical protein E3N88_37427 [Mikania micrantha]